MVATQGARRSAGERREAVIAAALTAFADRGFHAASTDEIARTVGISQPYLFRLFGTKQNLFIACVDRCYRRTLSLFEDASRDLSGDAALDAMGRVYGRLLDSDRVMLRAQLQSYAACADPGIAAAVRHGFGTLVQHAERVSGRPPDAIRQWLEAGMLLNVIAAMNLEECEEPWAGRLLAACGLPDPTAGS